jgi:hypothetical protein
MTGASPAAEPTHAYSRRMERPRCGTSTNRASIYRASSRSRKRKRWILPVAVLGSSGTNST